MCLKTEITVLYKIWILQEMILNQPIKSIEWDWNKFCEKFDFLGGTLAIQSFKFNIKGKA